MGKLEDARRAVLRVLKRSGDEWVELSTLQKPNIGGERAQARLRELTKLGHIIENRATTHGQEYRLTREASPRCPECSAGLGEVHTSYCRMRGREVMPGHTR